MEWQALGLDEEDLPVLEKTNIQPQSPKRRGTPKKYERLWTVRMSNELYIAWTEYCDRQGVSASQMVRDMMKRKLNTEAFMDDYMEKRKTDEARLRTRKRKCS